MKHAILSSLCFALTLSVAAAATPAQPVQPAQPATVPRPTLAVVVLDSLPRLGHYDGFNFIAEEFGNAFDARHWPLNVDFERFAANNEQRPLTLRLYDQGIRNDYGFEERRLRIWVILEVNGTKHDFGIVEYRYYPRAAERVDDVIHRMYRGAGDKIAQLVEPYLVPATANK